MYHVTPELLWIGQPAGAEVRGVGSVSWGGGAGGCPNNLGFQPRVPCSEHTPLIHPFPPVTGDGARTGLEDTWSRHGTRGPGFHLIGRLR